MERLNKDFVALWNAASTLIELGVVFTITLLLVTLTTPLVCVRTWIESGCEIPSWIIPGQGVGRG